MTPRTAVRFALARMEGTRTMLGEPRYRIVRCEHGNMLLKRVDGDISADNLWEFVAWVASYDLDQEVWR